MKSRKIKTKTEAKNRTDNFPTTVEVTVEYLRALRRAVGQLIDPETAEIATFGSQIFDPYGEDPDLPPECDQIDKESFARAPGTDVWIHSDDLPKATSRRLGERSKVLCRTKITWGLWPRGE